MPLCCFNFTFQDVPVGHHQQHQHQHEGRVGEEEEEVKTLAQVIKDKFNLIQSFYIGFKNISSEVVFV